MSLSLIQERKYDVVDGKIVNRATGKAIPDDEPIMIFRAKDLKATCAMIAYRDVCTDPIHKDVVQGRIDDFRAFKRAKPELCREPDSDPSCLPKINTDLEESPEMKTVNIGTQDYSIVHVADKPGAGGACHEYTISPVDHPSGEFGRIQFQKGAVCEAGVNGCHQEDLLAIVIHRLQGFQSGEFACRENAIALTKIEEAMHWLNHRTAARQQRGVEGTSQL